MVLPSEYSQEYMIDDLVEGSKDNILPKFGQTFSECTYDNDYSLVDSALVALSANTVAKVRSVSSSFTTTTFQLRL